MDLLELVVDTSPICVAVTANSGAGVLGNLLCSVANGLTIGTTLDQLLTTLVGADVQNLLLGLTAILNGALANLSTALATSMTPGEMGNCSVLNLSLGPLNLNILGLAVMLDNCAGGPVTVAVSGEHGALLGNLLCGLVNGGGILSGTSLVNVIGQLLSLLH